MRNIDESQLGAVDYLILGHNIKAIRQKRKMRQADMATQLGISTTHYSNFERGVRNISLGQLISICFALNASIETVLNGAIRGVRISQSEAKYSDTEMITDEWVDEMKSIRNECSTISQQIMLQICRDIAYLDRNLGEK